MAKLAFLGLGLMGTPYHVGGPGAGAATKVVVNSTLGAAIAAFGEPLALGEILGLDRSALLDVLADSAIGSTVRAKRANLESGHYPPSFKLSLALKDLAWATRSPIGPAGTCRWPQRHRAGSSRRHRRARAISTTQR